MKKIFIALLVLCFSSAALKAQLSLRPQVGINAPSITEDLVNGEWTSDVGYQFGADIQFGGDTYLQAGLNFQTTKLGIKDVGDIDVSNINIPVVLGFRFSEESKVLGLRLFVGPNFALTVNESLDDAITEINKDNFNDFKISGLAGAGLDLGLFFADVAYNFALNDFIESDNVTAKQNMFIINVGLRLGF